ncbi:hypothetical protein QTP70_003585 [Hemibagrus guttatus]|uniref:Retrotransposon gag domain-containing protein n=1 Tax=Hemibagrus guttatus TaxID=175788 RepID=A0AAE0VCL9_9TELE|nr:hypothetical protein QTP70_003585 [Hemibagrus guttatus]
MREASQPGCGRRSSRLRIRGRRLVLLLGGGRHLALLLGGRRRSALLLGGGCRSVPLLGCGRRLGPAETAEQRERCRIAGNADNTQALKWASAVWDADPLIRASFVEGIREVFEHPMGGKDISVQLMELRQGLEASADYAIRFRTLAAQSEWNDAALWAVFRAGLNPTLQTELACHVEATSLSQFVATAICLDNLQRQRRGL